jgi:hypothetical protein
VTIHEKILAFQGTMAGEHHRYRSWEHCYGYFHRTTPKDIAVDRQQAALQLGFYLASWGMYRGSSFLLQHAYTAHLGVIDQIVAPRFSALWEREFAGGDADTELVLVILDAADAIREAYRPFAPAAESRQASDTLVTKVILGTFGCLPACDRYFIDGWKSEGFKYSYLNSKFVGRVLSFCRDNLSSLREEQATIEHNGRMRHPLMKLVDMYFWQTGYEREAVNEGTGGAPRVPTASS